MPSNSGLPVYMGAAFLIAGFFLVFEWIPLAAISAFLIFAGMIKRSFEYDDGYYVPVEEIIEKERTWRGDSKWKAK